MALKQRKISKLLWQQTELISWTQLFCALVPKKLFIYEINLAILGRIDRKIEFPAPDEKARVDILKIHSRKMNLMRGINMRKIAEAIPGASGAEVKAVCTEAGMFALRERRIHVTQEDFEMAVGKV